MNLDELIKTLALISEKDRVLFGDLPGDPSSEERIKLFFEGETLDRIQSIFADSVKNDPEKILDEIRREVAFYHKGRFLAYIKNANFLNEDKDRPIRGGREHYKKYLFVITSELLSRLPDKKPGIEIIKEAVFKAYPARHNKPGDGTPTQQKPVKLPAGRAASQIVDLSRGKFERFDGFIVRRDDIGELIFDENTSPMTGRRGDFYTRVFLGLLTEINRNHYLKNGVLTNTDVFLPYEMVSELEDKHSVKRRMQAAPLIISGMAYKIDNKLVPPLQTKDGATATFNSKGAVFHLNPAFPWDKYVKGYTDVPYYLYLLSGAKFYMLYYLLRMVPHRKKDVFENEQVIFKTRVIWEDALSRDSDIKNWHTQVRNVFRDLCGELTRLHKHYTGNENLKLELVNDLDGLDMETWLDTARVIMTISGDLAKYPKSLYKKQQERIQKKQEKAAEIATLREVLKQDKPS